MDFNLLGNGSATFPSTLKDPFSKNTITDISINMRHPLFTAPGTVEWYGRILFQNGSTEGKQKFDNCKTFDELLLKMRNFLNELK